MYKRWFCLIFLFNTAFAAPWFTGPILAPAGKTIPPGHFNFEPYGFYTEYRGGFRNLEALPILSVGLTSFMDVQTSLPFDYSWVGGTHGSGIGDYSIGLGFQILRQQESNKLPDLRITIQELIPTGHFDELNPRKKLTDQTGGGAYRTTLSFNFQRLFTYEKHYLRTRLSMGLALPSQVFVEGFNTYGGNALTEGTVHLGSSYFIDLAGEFSLTQKWVAVMEGLYAHSNATGFGGHPGVTPGGTFASVGGSASESASLAPAIEYNFNANLGVIGGVWFSVTGPHAAKFTSAVIAINYFS